MGKAHSHAKSAATAAPEIPVDRALPFIRTLRDTLASRSQCDGSAAAGISRHVFVTVFIKKNPDIGNVLFDHFVRLSLAAQRGGSAAASESTPDGSISAATPSDVICPADFAARCQDVCNLITDHDQVHWYVSAFADANERVSAERLRALVLQAFEAAMWAHPDTVIRSLKIDKCLSGVADSCRHGKDELGVAYVRNWILEHCPRLLSRLHKYVVERITSGGERIPTEEEEAEPSSPPAGGSCVLQCASASSAASLHPALLWLLMCSLPERYTRAAAAESAPSLSGLALLDPGQSIHRLVESVAPKHWVSLYSSDDMGLSANRFQHHVLSYRGPSITLLRAEEERLFCVAADCGWRDSPHCWGGADCLLLQLLPRHQVLAAQQTDIIFYNYSARGLPSGLRVGGDRKSPALSVDRELSTLHHQGAPFRLLAVEVWGCGGPDQREAQLRSQKRDQVSVEQRRKVNIMADTNWSENPDRYLLEMSGAHKSYNYN